MFLDENGFFPGPRPAEPARESPRRAERSLTWLTLILTLMLLVLPVSAVAMADIWAYVSR